VDGHRVACPEFPSNNHKIKEATVWIATGRLLLVTFATYRTLSISISRSFMELLTLSPEMKRFLETAGFSVTRIAMDMLEKEHLHSWLENVRECWEDRQ